MANLVKHKDVIEKQSSSLNRPHFNKAIDRSCADPQDRQILKMLLGKKTGGLSPPKSPRMNSWRFFVSGTFSFKVLDLQPQHFVDKLLQGTRRLGCVFFFAVF